MKLNQLLPTPIEREVSTLCFDSRKLQKDCVFVAIRGTKNDGHQYLADAARAGATALVVETSENIPNDYKGFVYQVSDTRKALNELAAKINGLPANRLFNVAVTGTNGKTTITHMVEAIFNRAGLSTGVIGTINHHLGEKVWSTELTTPDPLSFQERLAEFVTLGARVLALEVSSIGLLQSRADEVPFDVAIFTNLTRDHLDYHRDMEEYYAAKRKLFAVLLKTSPRPGAIAIINADDEYGRRLIAEKSTKVWSYGQGPDCDLRFEVLEQGFAGTRFRIFTPMGESEMKIPMPGLHNVYNALAAVGAALSHGIRLEVAGLALAQFSGVKGRLEPVRNRKGLHVFVDYAHTDGALETVLHYLGEIRDALGGHSRIITVFGCGGDRDKGKRPLMMQAACQGSDLVVLTSDNPRSEDPQSILGDALKGANKKDLLDKVFLIIDRKEGIRKAIELAERDDVILIAGKGHEDYQQIGTQKFPFSDVLVVQEILQ